MNSYNPGYQANQYDFQPNQMGFQANPNGYQGNMGGYPGNIGLQQSQYQSSYYRNRMLVPMNTLYMTVFPFRREIMNYSSSSFNPTIVDNRISALEIQEIFNEIGRESKNFEKMKAIWNRACFLMAYFIFAGFFGMILLIAGSQMGDPFDSPTSKPLFVVGLIIFLSNFITIPIFFAFNIRKTMNETTIVIQTIQSVIDRHLPRLSSVGLRLKLPDYPSNFYWLELWADYKMAGLGNPMSQGIPGINAAIPQSYGASPFLQQNYQNPQPNYQNPNLNYPQEQQIFIVPMQSSKPENDNRIFGKAI